MIPHQMLPDDDKSQESIAGMHGAPSRPSRSRLRFMRPAVYHFPTWSVILTDVRIPDSY